MIGDLHVMPAFDVVKHGDSDECVCGPDVKFCPGGSIVVHHSLDGREHGAPSQPRSLRRPWRRCSACGGVCHFHDTDWVCGDCGSEWGEDHAPRFAAPS